MVRGNGKKGGFGWTSLSGKRSGARTSLSKNISKHLDRLAKGHDSRKVHDTKGKNNHGRTGGKPRGSGSSR